MGRLEVAEEQYDAFCSNLHVPTNVQVRLNLLMKRFSDALKSSFFKIRIVFVASAFPFDCIRLIFFNRIVFVAAFW
jgi:hypothetical protein